MSDLDDTNYTPRTPQYKARLEGWQAAREGKGVETNPYKDEADSLYRRIWLAGYREYVFKHPERAEAIA